MRWRPGATVSSAEQYFFNFGLGDLKGYDAIFAPQPTVASTDINPTIGNEIVQMNQIFELDGRLAGADVYGDIAPHGSNAFGVGFDTIAPTDANATTTFDSLVDGAAYPTADPVPMTISTVRWLSSSTPSMSGTTR